MTSFAFRSFRFFTSWSTLPWLAAASTGFVIVHCSPFFSRTISSFSPFLTLILSSSSGALISGSSALVVDEVPICASLFFA